MIKIVHIIPDLPPCGAEMVVLTYLRKFKTDPAYQVSAISLSRNQNRLYEQIAEEEGLDVTYLDQDISNNGLFARFKQIRQLHKKIKVKQPDIIHLHLSILWFVCLASIGTRVRKRFHTLHSDPEKTSYGIHVFIDWLCYKVFKVRTIALNQEMKEKADRLFHLDNTLVLRNGIDINKYNNKQRVSLRAQYDIKDDCFVLGHVGRFNKVKNHPKIIEVFQELKKKRPQTKLLLVGDGEDLKKIKELVDRLHLTEDVIFAGAQNDVPAFMSMMDCFIFPSLYEGLGIVLLEAQASGLRCVVSKSVPEETTVTDGVVRLPLTAPPSVWADAILGGGGYHHAPVNQPIQVYDIDNVIETLKKYYRYE